jgi:hypothetical protein
MIELVTQRRFTVENRFECSDMTELSTLFIFNTPERVGSATYFPVMAFKSQELSGEFKIQLLVLFSAFIGILSVSTAGFEGPLSFLLKANRDSALVSLRELTSFCIPIVYNS